ncbi:MAG TPA: phosphate ABC transporter substrate-binding protein [Coriobacteriia bacterium]|nr:phosphate ABC transporter substrate-binding protein [Coriobacteriia bacterium]
MKLVRSSKFVFAASVIALVAAMVAPAFASAATLKLSGSTTVYPVAQLLATGYKAKTGNNVTVTGGGSSVGIKDAIAGRVDVGMSSRDLKDAEKSSGAVETAFARDALTIVVNPKNTVKNLTEEQVRSIYRGEITNWKQVGGANRRIVLVGRTAASGTYEFFKEKFLLGKRQSSKTRAYSSNGMVRSAVKANKGAIGYVSMAYVDKRVRALKIGGVSATRANAVSGAYIYVRPLYWITKGAPAGEAKAFIDWTKSEAGQKIVAKEFLRY